MSDKWKLEISYLTNSDPRNVFILGRNEFANSVAKLINFHGFLDDETEETHYLGKKIAKFSQLNAESFVINCSTMRPRKASEKISTFTNHQIHVFALLENFSKESNKGGYWSDFRSDYMEYANEYIRFEKSLSDSTSLEIWHNLKHIRSTGDFLNLDDFPRSYGTHYFPDFIDFTKKDHVFYDIGCFDGETSLDFMKKYRKYKKIYAFEPNPENFDLLLTRFREFENIEIIKKGVSNVNQFLGFAKDRGSASHFDEKSKLKIEIITLDSLKAEPPTIIKMDIEGMERYALEGGRQIIERHRPILAISVYHLFDDIRVIFNLVFKFLPDSRFYLRHYSEGIHETVLFCVPN